MKEQTHTNLFIRSSLALALAMAAWLATAATAADEPMKPMKGGEHQMMLNEVNTKQPVDGKMMMQRCQAMKEQKQKMKEDMKAHDAELTEQLAKMNSAPQDKKTDLMAAVVTHMVEQRITMDARKAKMEEEMMKHMMQHMQMGKESMAQCPMMKDMKSMDDKSGDAHKEHQAQHK
jgi:hypothetical protein